MRKGLITLVTVLVLALAVPVTTAFAHDKTPIACVLSLAVLDPGSDEVKGHKIRNEGQGAAGWLDCDVDAMDGAISTLHGSKVKFTEDGSFEGKLKGRFVLKTAGGVLTGKFEGEVSGAMAVPGDPGTIYVESISGEWKLKDGTKGEGDFGITLTPFPPEAPVTLAGVGSLQGEVKLGEDD